jgi:hypothetical protein
MKKLLAVFVAAVAAVAIGVTAALSSGDGRTVLKFDTMAPVVAPYTGPTNPIRGVPGGGYRGSSSPRRDDCGPTGGSRSRWRAS